MKKTLIIGAIAAAFASAAFAESSKTVSVSVTHFRHIASPSGTQTIEDPQTLQGQMSKPLRSIAATSERATSRAATVRSPTFFRT